MGLEEGGADALLAVALLSGGDYGSGAGGVVSYALMHLTSLLL